MPRTHRLSGTAKAVKVVATASSRLAATLLLLSVVAIVAGCAQQGPESGSSNSGASTPTASASPAETTSPSASGTTSASGIDLTVTFTESPDATPRTFRLVAADSTPGAESTLPDPAAALAAVETHGAKAFFPVPDPNRVCTEQYGGPEVAHVTGWFHSKEVNATFKRTNGCEISQWRALAPLFGALGGSTGAI